jgi:nucleoside-triphosphatase
LLTEKNAICNLPRYNDIDQIAVPSMIPAKPGEIVVIDEIGKMECFSLLFRKTLIKALDSENPVIGSIAHKGDKFIEAVKARDDVLLVPVTQKNRDAPELMSLLLSEQVKHSLSKALLKRSGLLFIL